MTANIDRPFETAINLAEIEPFTLGSATVDPGHRRITWNGECSEELEPRVMKVLVALAQAEGHVVSRDRLIHLCWDDRIVGDDAINRCVQSIRRFAKLIEPPAFRIETTARVGYSLIVERAPPEHASAAPLFAWSNSPDTKSSNVPTRPTRLLSIGAITVVLASAAAVLPAGRHGHMIRIAIMADSARDAQLASDLKVDLNQFAGGTLTDVSLVDSPRNSDLVLGLSTTREGQVTRGNLTLSDGRSKDMLWSGTAEAASGPATGADTILRGQLAAKLGNVFACASKMAGDDSKNLDTGAKRLFLAACTRMDDMVDQHDVDTLKKLTATAPKFAAGWSYLALAQAELLTTAEAMKTEAPADILSDRRRTAAALQRAQAIDPNLGTNFATMAALEPAWDWARRLEILEEGIARDADEYSLYQAESSTLASVGLTDESLSAASRAAELKPFSADAHAALIWALVHNGQIARARAELASAEKLWPDAEELTSVRFSIELRYGDARVAKRMIDSGQQAYSTGCGQDLMLRARLSPTPANIADLIHYATIQTRKLPSAAPQRLLALAQFDATNEAYSVLDQRDAVPAMLRSSEVLFRPQFASFRRDARFPLLAAKLGLLQFWRDSGRWPDFCSDPGLTYDCKAEAARLLGSGAIARRSPSAIAEARAAAGGPEEKAAT
jgi:DNA-binding winged helix-turn-helix (wHTH) protein/tetratricopeptide (TPR) repeat protein